jgi:ABC-type tungstate transport system permease subunit
MRELASSTLVCALGAVLLAGACRDERPRALILADGGGPAVGGWVDDRVDAFERARGREVRVLRVGGAEDALNLATRGDADVALVPEAAPIDRFVSGQHGREAGRGQGGARILVVDARMHPKVDTAGAEDLAKALLEP